MSLMGTTIEGLAVMLPIDLPGFYFRKVLQARKELVVHYQEIIAAKRASPPEVPCSMIDYVMAGNGKDGQTVDDVELQDFCVNMTFAGHDTTLATMQTTLHYLHANPDITHQLRTEIDSAWDGKAPMSRELFERVPKSRAFLMEALRLMPPVPFVGRDLAQPAHVDGYDLPTGTCVMLGVKEIMDERIRAHGGNLSVCDLSHWMDKDGAFIGEKQLYDFASFSIFGAGGRMCIGYKFAMDELLVFLINLIHGYDVSVTHSDKVVFPFAFWKVTAKFTRRHL